MLNLLFWLAMWVCAVGALAHDRASIALLASSAVCITLDFSDIQFWFFIWYLIDFAVIAAIVRKRMPRKDWVIIALFPVAWGLYFIPDPARYIGTTFVVVAQMLVAFPYRDFWCCVIRKTKSDIWDDIFSRDAVTHSLDGAAVHE